LTRSAGNWGLVLQVALTTVQLPSGNRARFRSQLQAMIAGRALRTVFQPVMELDTGVIVGFEALARGPAGSDLERPDRLFAAARHAGLLRELDTACRTAALDCAGIVGYNRPWTLFLNVEPETLDGGPFGEPDLPFAVVLELTERALTARPAELLQTVTRVREAGWGVALDDVGADPASLALLPLLQPDIIKLDLRLIQDRPDGAIAAIMHAVNAEAERSGSIVLAEGIETTEHLQTARAFGATLGQGWLLGRPGALPSRSAFAAGRDPVGEGTRFRTVADEDLAGSPYELVTSRRTPRAAVKPLLIEASKQLEQHALSSGESALVVASFQEARYFTPSTQARFAELVGRAAFVGVLAKGMSEHPLSGVRGALLDPADPVVGEWDIAVIGPHFAACLVARDLGDDGPDAQRRFDFAISHDRDLTAAVARRLMSRIAPLRAAPPGRRPPGPRDPS
jgi:EAL domain-containing protein (putative c-di-GMP-specific phosphodiesterase class I)